MSFIQPTDGVRCGKTAVACELADRIAVQERVEQL